MISDLDFVTSDLDFVTSDLDFVQGTRSTVLVIFKKQNDRIIIDRFTSASLRF